MKLKVFLILMFYFTSVFAESVMCSNSYGDVCTIGKNTVACSCGGYNSEYLFWSDFQYSMTTDRPEDMNSFCLSYADSFCSNIRNYGPENVFCSTDTGFLYMDNNGDFFMECYDNILYPESLIKEISNYNKSEVDCEADVFHTCGENPSSLLNYCMKDTLQSCVDYVSVISEKCSGYTYDSILKQRLLSGEFVGMEGRSVAGCCIKNYDRSKFIYDCISKGESCRNCFDDYFAIDEDEASGSGGSDDSASGCSVFLF